MYIGSVIGAGFASGQEIMQFFIMFGDRAIHGVILSTVLFSYLGAVVLYISSTLQTENYNALFKHTLGPAIGKFMDAVSMFMLVGGLGVMFAGSGAIFSEHLGMPKYLGILIAAGITCMVICGGLQGVLMANAFLVPVKVFVIVALCLWILIFGAQVPENMNQVAASDKVAGHWAWSAVLYVSYNMILSVAVLASLGRTITTKQGILCGIAGGMGLGLTAGIITLAGLSFYPLITEYQVPLLYLAGHVGEAWKKMLAFLIWLAILTTAIANAHGFASRMASPNGRDYKVIGVAITICTIPIAGMEFTKLVKNLYPIFGYAGLVLICALFISPVYRFIFNR
jgi:uncharacterized membrane protein YkvI